MRSTSSFLRSLVLFLLGLCCSVASANIHGTASRHGSFGSLVAALDFTGLVDDLSAPGPFTIFAPTNTAFGSLPPGLLECLLRESNRSVLKSILLYHVVDGAISSTDLFQGQKIPTLLDGAELTVDFTDFLKINDATVIGVDLQATNGVIHAISSVLIPPLTDIAAFLTSCADPDIPSTAVAAGGFDTLVAALAATDLVGALTSPQGPFTVFAPTDEAFGDLPDGLVPCLLLEENLPLLSDILLYHVVGGAAVLSTDLEQGQFVPTLLDRTVVEVDLRTGIKINDSRVVQADVVASNGVIHAIDQVLIPPGTDVEAFLATCPSSSGPPAEADIPSLAGSAGVFNTLVAALTATDLVGALTAPRGPFTVFAPTDEAFGDLPDGLVPCLLLEENLALLTSILLYHVVAGAAVKSTELVQDQLVATALDRTVVEIDLRNGIRINDSRVLQADVSASNGVIHVIDEVLIPPGTDVAGFLATCPSVSDSQTLTDTPPEADIPSTAVAAGGFDTLVAALTATDLVGALTAPEGPFTVFAPTDDAFGALPEGLVPCLLLEENLPLLSDILLYHVVGGAAVRSTELIEGQFVPTLLDRSVLEVDLSDGIRINDSRVINADVVASNGVIHVIDAVLIPPGTDVEGFLGTCSQISDTTEALESLQLTTLTQALSAADLIEEISNPSFPATVFGPTDEAFASLPEGLLQCLLDDVTTLSDILLYHVVDGGVLSTALSDGQRIPTVNGDEITVLFQDGSIKINDATVVNADNSFGTNSIVHVIDAVLVPGDVNVGAYLNSCQTTGDVQALIGDSSANTVLPYASSLLGVVFASFLARATM